MSWRWTIRVLLAACAAGFSVGRAAENPPVAFAPGKTPSGEPIRYVTLDAPPGMSQAVIVRGQALVHTRQLLPLDEAGKLVGAGSLDAQIDQVLDNLQAVLNASGSGLDRLVRVNVYALAAGTVDRVRERLSKRLGAPVRPAFTTVLTPLPHRDAAVAVDAVAAAADQGDAVALVRCAALAGNQDVADAAILPRGGVAYLSGAPADGGLTMSAVDKSMTALGKMLEQLQLTPAQVVHLKVFLRPASSADAVQRQLQKFFPGQVTPPVVFVEWLAPPPIEIELIAHWPAAGESAAGVQYYNPPDVSPLQIFSRAALIRGDQQIYVSGLLARKAGRGQDQALDVFDQLRTILDQAGSDLRHLVKATYYASDDDSARGLDRARLWLFDQDRPPAASKCMVHGVGQSGRTVTLDMIAVGKGS